MPGTERSTRSYVELTSDGVPDVVLKTEDLDRFVMTQRDAVEACRQADQMISESQRLAEDFQTAVEEIRVWCEARSDIAVGVISPRPDDVIVVLVASTEDESGELHAQMSELDLDMFNRNKFRFYWLLLRASEGLGLGSFVDESQAKVIYRADSRSA